MWQQDEEKRKLSDGEQVKRVPIHESRNILTVDTPEGYVDRWVLDHPKGRIERFLQAGYTHVRDADLKVGEENIDGERAPGDVVSKSEGKSGNMLYLMRISKDLYDSDQAEKQRRVDEAEQELYKQVEKPGHYGSLKIKGAGGVKQPE